MVNLYLLSETRRGGLYGVGSYVRELLTALSDAPIRIHVLHLFSEKSRIEMEEKAGVSHWYFPRPVSVPNGLDGWEVRALYGRNLVYLLRLMIKDQENLLFHLNYHDDADLVDELRAAFNCKIVSISHFSDWGFIIFDHLAYLRRCLRQDPENEQEKTVRKMVEREQVFYAKMDHIICLSEYMRNFFLDDYGFDPQKIHVIPNGLAEGLQIEKEKNKRFFKNKWHLPKREKIILYVGRLDRIKGVNYLVKAFEKVLDTCPCVRLLIAGSGDYDLCLREGKAVATQIVFTGFLDKDSLYELYRLADVGVVPSLFEPFGYVPVEMMMHGLPIVATTTSGLNEVVDESCGRKVPLSVSTDEVTIDTDLLAEQIVYLLQHPEEARRLGQNGRRRYLSEYTSERFGQRMLAFYESLN